MIKTSAWRDLNLARVARANIRPKLALPSATVGALKLAWLKTLNASPRNWMLARSRMGNS